MTTTLDLRGMEFATLGVRVKVRVRGEGEGQCGS
jgi:hypothetical protein